LLSRTFHFASVEHVNAYDGRFARSSPYPSGTNPSAARS
jgi:hypothetical protein